MQILVAFVVRGTCGLSFFICVGLAALWVRQPIQSDQWSWFHSGRPPTPSRRGIATEGVFFAGGGTFGLRVGVCRYASWTEETTSLSSNALGIRQEYEDWWSRYGSRNEFRHSTSLYTTFYSNGAFGPEYEFIDLVPHWLKQNGFACTVTEPRNPFGSGKVLDVVVPAKWATICFAIPPLIWRAGPRRRHNIMVSRLKAGLCLRCGYDMRSSSSACPECGKPRSTT